MQLRRLAMAALTVLMCGACGADAPVADGAGSVAVTTDSKADAASGDRLLGGGTVDVVALSRDTAVALWFWAPG